MSEMFNSLGVAASGMDVFKTWIDATSDNVANINTVKPTSEAAYQEKFVVANAVEGGLTGKGVEVGGVQLGDANGLVVYDPTNPLADAQGMVRRPSTNLIDQMTNLVIAQRAYSANVTVFERARDSYQAALEIGK